jgi:hypothetical protein
MTKRNRGRSAMSIRPDPAYELSSEYGRVLIFTASTRPTTATEATKL